MSNDNVVTATNTSSAQNPGALHRAKKIHHAAMLELHTLRLARRARRVDHIGEIAEFGSAAILAVVGRTAHSGSRQIVFAELRQLLDERFLSDKDDTGVVQNV